MKRRSLVRHVASLLSLLSTAGYTAEDTNEVVISGQSKRRFLDRAGNTSVVRPTDETQFDVNAQFKLDPSVAGTDQARPSAGGFSLPLFRGNDAHSSHVFLDDVELQDPFTGYPLIEDIDMRAFGELRIHRGLAPWDLAVTAPGGVIQFISRKVTRDQFASGLIYGDVFVASGWGEIQAAGENWATRTYLRRHTASGHYSFYSDNGTIRNVDDDITRTRDNNDRSANMGSTSFKYADDRNTAELFAWTQNANQGLPVKLATGDGGARLKSDTAALSGKVHRQLGDFLGVGISAQELLTSRTLRDSGQNISRVADQDFSTRTQQMAAAVDLANDDESLLSRFQVKRASASISLRPDLSSDAYRPHADQTSFYGGIKWRTFDWLEWEAKSDVSSATSSGDSDSSAEKTHKNFGLTNLFKLGNWSLWMQGAKFERLPSIFERDGNGAEFLGNSQLQSESGVFGELGVRQKNLSWQTWQGERALTFWSEDLRERIRSLPISSTKWKSNNMGTERYRGLEARERWWIHLVELEGAVSYTKATTERRHIIPRVSLWQGVFGTAFHMLSSLTLRTTSRYQGPSYDDEENTLEIGDVWVHDVTIDRYTDESWWAAGLAVLNVSDVKSLRVRDVATNQGEGRIAWQTRQGEPLPGRQYVVRFTGRL